MEQVESSTSKRSLVFCSFQPYSRNGSLLTGQTLYAACSTPWIELTLPSRETTLDGRFTANHFHFHVHKTYLWLLKDGALQVHLEIRIDGGGGEAGEQVIQLAHKWNWTHGVKVVIMILDRCRFMDCIYDSGEVCLSSRYRYEQTKYWPFIAQAVIVSDTNQGLVAAWRNAWWPKVTRTQVLKLGPRDRSLLWSNLFWSCDALMMNWWCIDDALKMH